ncbi:hypothetical protein VIGAN_09042700 [Vigna angularis var. angularis]|uniref:Pentatricopeptide repeat-containing protein n=1 Tax=Vigna angularis var. angularis TaxID=157739 RepID=A0A0S3SWA5_PHAAN|nr:hypothetical protein VIGAN_09042700 [Vigna angularis var. angularis]
MGRFVQVQRVSRPGFTDGSILQMWNGRSAKNIFKSIPKSKVVYGNVMISGYVAKGKLLEALSLFREMRKSYVELNAIICTSVLAACS